MIDFKLFVRNLARNKLYFAITVVALTFVIVLGILAMATYFIQQRPKEIGLRRVNGAKVSDVLEMLVWGGRGMGGLAFFIALPFAWYRMDDWPGIYPSPVGRPIGVYTGVGVMAGLVAVLTVSWQSCKAAGLNPVKTLRNK